MIHLYQLLIIHINWILLIHTLNVNETLIF